MPAGWRTQWPGPTSTREVGTACQPSLRIGLGSSSTASSRRSVRRAGSGTGTAATLTSLIVSVSESLDQAESLLQRCGTYRTGTAGVATSTIRTEILPPPTASAGVDTLALRRTTTTGGEINPLVTSTTTLIGQRDGARVYVEYRASGGAAMPADAGTALDALFQASVAAAWP